MLENECKPEPMEPESEYHSADYNCNSCDNSDCEFWSDYNYELQAEMDEAKLWSI